MFYMARKFITYFDKEGEDYTDELIMAVKDKLEMADNINKILIASATGKSALKCDTFVNRGGRIPAGQGKGR